MAIYYDAPVNPDDVTTFIRQVPTPSGLNFLSEIPDVFDDDNVIDWNIILETNRTAQFRSFDGSIHVSDRDTGTDNRVRMIPISDSLSVGEYERLQEQFVRFQGGNIEALKTAIYNDGQKLTNYVKNRLELAWGDIFTDGKLTINENGYQGEADFGVPSSQKVAPTTAWTDRTNATVLSDITTWVDAYFNLNGDVPEVMRVSRVGLRNVLGNKEIINATYGAQTGRTRAELGDVNIMLAGQGLPEVVFQKVSRLSVDVAGTPTTTPVIGDNIALFTPANLGEICATHYGVSATALELVESNQSALTFSEAPGIVGLVEKSGPPYRQFTYVDAVVMPVLANAYRLMIGTTY